MKKYWYFISYNYWTNTGSGIGNAEIPLKNVISNIETIREIQDKIKSEIGCDGVSINNFILLRKTDN